MGRSVSPRRRSVSRSQSTNRRERSRSRSRSGPKKRRSYSPSRSRERNRGVAGGGGGGSGDRNARNRGSRSRSRERNNDSRRSRSRSPRGRDFRGGAPGRYGGDRGGGRGRPQPQSLLVRNLSPNTTPERLRRAFSRQEGDIRDVYLPKDYSTNQPRGFAFIEFNDSRDAREIKYQMDRTTFEGREIAVLFAQQRRKTPEQMREAPPSYVVQMSSIRSPFLDGNCSAKIFLVTTAVHAATHAHTRILVEGSFD